MWTTLFGCTDMVLWVGRWHRNVWIKILALHDVPKVRVTEKLVKLKLLFLLICAKYWRHPERLISLCLSFRNSLSFFSLWELKFILLKNDNKNYYTVTWHFKAMYKINWEKEISSVTKSYFLTMSFHILLGHKFSFLQNTVHCLTI